MSSTEPGEASGAASSGFGTSRLEAFSDGVLAVIITIMALDLRAPEQATLHALSGRLSNLLVFALSFTMIAIYWNNHHHLLKATHSVSGGVMWANMHLLFWLSLIPALTAWMARFPRRSVPAAAYGAVALGAAVAYWVLVHTIIRNEGPDSEVARSVERDVKGLVSAVAYAVAVGLAVVSPYLAYAIYVGVAIVWLVPDRRFDRA